MEQPPEEQNPKCLAAEDDVETEKKKHGQLKKSYFYTLVFLVDKFFLEIFSFSKVCRWVYALLYGTYQMLPSFVTNSISDMVPKFPQKCQKVIN